MLTATIETNLQQGDLGVDVDGMKGDLSMTEKHFSGDQGAEREELQKSRVHELRSGSLLRRSSP